MLCMVPVGARRGFMAKKHRVQAPGLNFNRCPQPTGLLFLRHQLGIYELQEFGYAEFVHAGAMVVGFDS